MIFGFSEGETDSDDGLPVAAVSTVGWQPASHRKSVASAFHSCPVNVVGLDVSAEAEAVAPFPVLENPPLCPAHRLLRMALLVNSPQQHVPLPPRKRLRGKQSRSVGALFHNMVQDPGADPAPHLSATDRRNGYHEFERRVAADSGKSVRHSRPRAAEMWRRAERKVQNGWAVLAMVTREMYTKVGHRTRVLKSLPDDGGGRADDGQYDYCNSISLLGGLFTWNSDIGLQDPAVLQLVSEGFRGDALLRRMLDLPLYIQAWSAFCRWATTKASAVGFVTHATGMELCSDGDRPHRVHLHGFFGPDMNFGKSRQGYKQIVLELDDWAWQGFAPDVQPLLPHRKGKGVFNEVVGGVYYVLANKIGSMYRAGNRWPFLDQCT